MDAIVVIAGSAGGFEALRRFVAALPTRCTASFFIVIYFGSYPSVLPSLLARTRRRFRPFATPLSNRRSRPRPWKNVSCDVGDALCFSAVRVEAPEIELARAA
jgi:CheB methylesterase